MRRLLVILIFLLSCLSQAQVSIMGKHRVGGSSFQIVQHKPFQNWTDFFSTWDTSFDNPTQAGNSIIVVVLGNSVGSIGITDNHSGGSNSYHQDLSFTMGVVLVRYFSVANAGSAQTITTTFNSSAHIQIELIEVKGLLTSNIADKTSFFDNTYHNNPSGLAFTSGNTAATSQAKEFLVGFTMNVFPGNVVWTDDSPWTLLDQVKIDGMRIATRTTNTTGAYAYTGTYTNTGDTQVFASIVTYKIQ